MTEAKKESIAKWDKKNMVTLTCRCTKVRATAFKAACADLETKPNRVFQEAIDKTIAEADKKRAEEK